MILRINPLSYRLIIILLSVLLIGRRLYKIRFLSIDYVWPIIYTFFPDPLIVNVHKSSFLWKLFKNRQTNTYISNSFQLRRNFITLFVLLATKHLMRYKCQLLRAISCICLQLCTMLAVLQVLLIRNWNLRLILYEVKIEINFIPRCHQWTKIKTKWRMNNKLKN